MLDFTTAAKIIYVLVLLWLVGCIWRGHRDKHINLWHCITITAKDGKTYTDPKKVAYIGAFVVMAVAFAYLAVVDQLTDWFCATFVSAFVLGKWLGDREQRLSSSKPKEGGT